MLVEIGLWLLIVTILIWAAIDPITRICQGLMETLLLVFHSKPVDVKAKFGEWAVVTGSTDGIGKAYAIELASRGVNLVLISRILEKLERTKSEISLLHPGIQIKVIVADFSKGRELFQDIEDQLKDIQVGILVNNVGKQYTYPMYLGEVPKDELWEMININVGATTLMTRIVIGQMMERRKGAIVNISSGSELQPLPLMTVYAATKIFIRSFSEGLRSEYSPFGITVQHLAPLFVNTKMNAFTQRLQVSSIFVPDATTYARNAVATLGKINSSTGYWAHSIQHFFVTLPPIWIRTKIGKAMNQVFRDDYLKQKKI
ncbi:hydroxysteroid dehydrogenase-like protein 1 [Orussus abietinus]|uniref:hydroxysteroid dehydrogenase-like protein 1 n=1 Tax=Orussus abietinus TaxID=222816 RepID=UPI000625149E|nr:hydroxysteroid dehydrogenase-like protein 1 [Orussus abietinus]XP_012275311.1 hydroxysteroid dehydrogenase-like protein 1 [Orussus abietinus]XP_012275312.1 hydroxysteroid dehydrogenase-like protein 1 [Orussus abietinus]